ncbi:hypothetical protein ACFSTC_23500 [Nonomuraea ferruginea]
MPAVCALACAVALRTLPEPPRAEIGGLGRHVGAVLRRPWALLVFALAFAEGAVLLGMLTFLATVLQHQGVSSALARPGRGRLRPGRLPVLPGGQAAGGRLAGVVAHPDRRGPDVRRVRDRGRGGEPRHGRADRAAARGGWSFMHSSLQTWATSVVPQARGTTVAFFASCLFMGSAVASWAAGPLAGSGSYGLLFGLAAAVAAPLTVVAAVSRRRYGARAPEEDAAPRPE